ncbi:tetratricopeptide repeat protein [Tautonia marina]|uniref:tetratricopeptide repeat protein n=1 Tax=Tautonia marina TaxID=2653855 RepID=UPI0012612498|nr:tetratricopeptide repeat protein [Tautonia marina]
MSEPLSRSWTFPSPDLAVAVLAMAVALATVGCRGGSSPGLRGVLPAAQRGADVEAPESQALMSRWIGAPRSDDRVRRVGGLILQPDGWASKEVPTDDQRAAEFEAAEQLYLQGDLDAAERAFARIARKERPSGIKRFADSLTELEGLDDFDRRRSPWGMRSLYYLGEIRFKKGNYVGAHDTFEELLKEYPGTPHLDEAVSREFQIAQTWLNQVRPADDQPPLPWHARFRGGLPLIDTGGHAVSVLEHVRQNDPAGPLADDAVKLIADHYASAGDHESAGFYYDQLANDHPKSPLLHDALMSSVDSKLNAYIGPEYDFTGLAEARDTAKRAMQLFPERLTSTSDDLYHTLDLIADQEAERDYTMGEWYRSAGYVISAEYYFGGIVQKWPRSEWAEKARVQLAELAKMPRKETAPSKMMVQPGGNDPFAQGISSGNPGGLGPGTSIGP